MKRHITACALALGLVPASWASPSVLTSLRAIHNLSNAQAEQSLPVRFEATVTYFRLYENTLFVQDGDVAIYVAAPADTKLALGDRVLITGTTGVGFKAFVVPKSIVVLRPGVRPNPAPVNFDSLIDAAHDCQFVTVRGVVRSADMVVTALRPTARLHMLIRGGHIEVNVDTSDASAVNSLLDAEVEVSGAVSGRFDGKMQQTGILIHSQSLADVRVLKPANGGPWSLPISPMDRILDRFHVENRTERVRVSGTVTYYQPNSAVVLQDGSKSLWIATEAINPVRIGDRAEASGFPDVHGGFLMLTEGEIRDDGVWSPVAPQPVTWQELATSRHIFDLVSIEGRVVMEAHQKFQEEYVLVADGQVFSAIYRFPVVSGVAPSLPLQSIPLGSKAKVTGICGQDNSNPFDAQVPFKILLRTPEDIEIVANPPLMSVRNLTILVALLLAAVLLVGADGWRTERTARRRTAALAELESRRSLILEDINGTRPLGEVIDQIAALVSFQLQGAPVWCRISGNFLPQRDFTQEDGLRIVQCQVASRSGSPSGTILAGFAEGSAPSALEHEALSMGAGLVELAIETRRLYTDLLHRSEFDMLTDIHNRFSLDRHLDLLIADGERSGGRFGLIYIDLDQFKQVNDLHGHRAGDLYLQEVAWRMKRQMRADDLLARVGGDEFVALAPRVRSRDDVEEMAERLRCCFDAPFEVDGVMLSGTASVGIALYPEDGVSKDSLLSAADAAMYVAKKSRHCPGEPNALEADASIKDMHSTNV